MKNTKNYSLLKPDGEDFYNVEDFNTNADTIDTELKKNADSVTNLKEVAKTGNASDTTVTFTQASSRTNLTSGEKLSISFGKIKKWFADLKTVAFSGSYNDLSNKPTSLPANGGNADTVDGKHATDLQNYNNLTNKPTSLPANGGNADTVDGKHASDLTAFKAFSSSNEAFKSRYIGYFTVISEGIEGLSFKGETYKDSAPDRDFDVDRYSRFYTNGKEWFFRLDQYSYYNGYWYSPTIEKLNGNADTVDGKHASDLQNYNNLTNKPTSLPANGGNADTVDGKHASNFVTDSPTEANKYTTVLSWALAQNQSGVAYSSADSSLSNAEDKPSNGQYGQFHYLLLKGETYRRTVIAFEYGATGHNIYRRSITVNAWYGDWVKINDGGNADTVDGYHAYQFQNYGSNGTPEGTYLKSQYDGSKGKFYIKAYDKDSGNYLTGVYVDYAANSDRLQDKTASDFYSVHTYPADKTTNPVTWDNGIYTVEEEVKKSNGFPFDSGWVHATIYVSGQRNTDPNTGERRGYGVVRYLDNANNEFIKTQHWNENEWSEWRRIITEDVLSYKETEPPWIGGGFTVMLEEK